MKLQDIRKKYAEECRNFIKSQDSKLFVCKQDFYHFNDPLGFNGDIAHSTTLVTEAFAKITGYQANGEPLVRMLSMEKLFRRVPFEKKPEISITVNLRNWTGYSFSLLSDIIDDFIEDESILPQFILDSFYKDDYDMTSGKWRISAEDFDNNVRPWLKRKEQQI